MASTEMPEASGEGARKRQKSLVERAGQKAAAQRSAHHVGYLCEAHEKILLVIDILLQDKPDSSIIFCNTSECVDFVRKYLQRCGFVAPASRAKRSVVVASDAAARGEHKRYGCVINFDVPFAVRNYSTRLAMLARNGRCISLLCDYYSDFAPPIIARYRLQCGWPATDLSNYRLPERNTVRDWLKLESDKQPGERSELESGRKAGERSELESDKQPGERSELESGKQPGERSELESGRKAGERHRRSRKPRQERAAGKRSKSTVSYASQKADRIVAAKSQRKSVWERILSFLTK